MHLKYKKGDTVWISFFEKFRYYTEDAFYEGPAEIVGSAKSYKFDYEVLLPIKIFIGRAKKTNEIRIMEKEIKYRV